MQAVGCDRKPIDRAGLLNSSVNRGGKRGTGGVDPALARALDAQRVQRTSRILAQQDLDLWHLTTSRHQIVGKARCQRLAILVIDELLEQGSADALRHPADDLTLDQHRIDGTADSIADQIALDRDPAGQWINSHLSNMDAVG